MALCLSGLLCLGPLNRTEESNDRKKSWQEAGQDVLSETGRELVSRKGSGQSLPAGSDQVDRLLIGPVSSVLPEHTDWRIPARVFGLFFWVES